MGVTSKHLMQQWNSLHRGWDTLREMYRDKLARNIYQNLSGMGCSPKQRGEEWQDTIWLFNMALEHHRFTSVNPHKSSIDGLLSPCTNNQVNSSWRSTAPEEPTNFPPWLVSQRRSGNDLGHCCVSSWNQDKRLCNHLWFLGKIKPRFVGHEHDVF